MPKYANSSSRPVRKSRVTALTPRARGARKIEGILQEKARAPSGGMIGEKLIKPIGVLGHDLHGVRAVGLEDANRPGGSHPVAVKKTMISRTIFCVGSHLDLRISNFAAGKPSNLGISTERILTLDGFFLLHERRSWLLRIGVQTPCAP
jgi:hypothetical protein